MPTRWTSVRTLLCGTRQLEFGLPNGRKSPSTPPPGSCPTPNGCLAVTMGLVRTPQGHQQSSWRTPVLKPSSNSTFPEAWITEPATDPRFIHIDKWFKNKIKIAYLVTAISPKPDVNDSIIPPTTIVPFGNIVVGPHFPSFLLCNVVVKFRSSCRIKYSS